MIKSSFTINETTVRRLLSVVDAGLSSGLGEPKPGQMCVEAAVCYALGLPHGDNPKCVSPVLRSLKIRLNDSNWSSKEARAKGLRRLAVAQLGSKGHLDEREFVKRLVNHAIRKSVPQALRSAASMTKNAEHKASLLAAADRCEREGTRESTIQAKKAAAAYDAATAADAVYAAVAYASDAATAADAAYASNAATAADAAYASNAAADAAADAKKSTRDKSLADYAESVVQILIELKAPGCQWLKLTEAEV